MPENTEKRISQLEAKVAVQEVRIEAQIEDSMQIREQYKELTIAIKELTIEIRNEREERQRAVKDLPWLTKFAVGVITIIIGAVLYTLLDVIGLRT
jgi:uncharacterized coiled-coil protein SlyX